MDVWYQLEDHLGVGEDESLDLLARSGLAERRPVDEPETIRGMPMIIVPIHTVEGK